MFSRLPARLRCSGGLKAAPYPRCRWAKKTPRRANGQYSDQPYHAVSIAYPLQACEQVLQLNNKRYLAKDAPPLPLSGCQARSCQCHYRHYRDRRGRDRRSAFSSSMYLGAADQDRRSGKDRRHTPEAGERQSI